MGRQVTRLFWLPLVLLVGLAAVALLAGCDLARVTVPLP